MHLDFTGPALVTGGGTGIGRALASLLARVGVDTVICGRRAEPLEATADELGTGGGKVVPLICDVRDRSQVADLFSRAEEALGSPPSILVNNAGGQFPKKALDLTQNGWRAVVSSNLDATFWCSQEFGRRFSRSGLSSGVILNMTIPWVFRGSPGLSHAVAARAGVVALTKNLALEWGNLGIRVNCIAPGMVVTDGFIHEELKGDGSAVEQLQAASPLQRAATPEEIARAMAFMVSVENSFMTGHTAFVDGGASLGPGIDLLDLESKGNRA